MSSVHLQTLLIQSIVYHYLLYNRFHHTEINYPTLLLESLNCKFTQYVIKSPGLAHNPDSNELPIGLVLSIKSILSRTLRHLRSKISHEYMRSQVANLGHHQIISAMVFQRDRGLSLYHLPINNKIDSNKPLL